MRTIEEIRLENLRTLARNEKSFAEFARNIGMAPTLLQNYIGLNPTKLIGSGTARKAEVKLEIERGWLDHDHSQPAAEPLAGRRQTWPFEKGLRSRYERLPPQEKERIEMLIRITVEHWERLQPGETKAAGL